jgi:hypothetical protein
MVIYPLLGVLNTVSEYYLETYLVHELSYFGLSL